MIQPGRVRFFALPPKPKGVTLRRVDSNEITLENGLELT